jgi:hypothetical protein
VALSVVEDETVGPAGDLGFDGPGASVEGDGAGAVEPEWHPHKLRTIAEQSMKLLLNLITKLNTCAPNSTSTAIQDVP